MSYFESFFLEYSNVLEIDEECPICNEKLTNIDVLEKCKHSVHFECIQKFATINNLKETFCPLCRSPTPDIEHTPQFDITHIVKIEKISESEVLATDHNGITMILSSMNFNQEDESDDSFYLSESSDYEEI